MTIIIKNHSQIISRVNVRLNSISDSRKFSYNLNSQFIVIIWHPIAPHIHISTHKPASQKTNSSSDITPINSHFKSSCQQQCWKVVRAHCRMASYRYINASPFFFYVLFPDDKKDIHIQFSKYIKIETCFDHKSVVLFY